MRVESFSPGWDLGSARCEETGEYHQAILGLIHLLPSCFRRGSIENQNPRDCCQQSGGMAQGKELPHAQPF